MVVEVAISIDFVFFAFFLTDREMEVGRHEVGSLPPSRLNLGDVKVRE